MDEKVLMTGRIHELSEKTYQNEYVTHTAFLSSSDISMVLEIMASEGMPKGSSVYNGVSFCFYGGYDDYERAVLCFLPSYLDIENFIVNEEKTSEIVSCLRIEPVNIRFAEDLSHRDYLGALMNMGVDRSQTGDIICDSETHSAYVFVTSEMKELVSKELIRVGRTSVKCVNVSPEDCSVRRQYEELEGNVASERLDCILAFVYRLSRSKIQQIIEAQDVFVDGETAYSGGYDVKEGSRISVRGFGKFIYDGQTGTSRKGRLFVKVRLFI